MNHPQQFFRCDEKLENAFYFNVSFFSVNSNHRTLHVHFSALLCHANDYIDLPWLVS